MTQHHDRSNVLSGMKMAAPEEGRRKIFLAAKKKKANVHLLNTGHARKGLMVWYWVTCWETWGAKGITTCIAFLETRLHWFVHSIHLPPREREAVVRPAADPAFSSWLRRYLPRAAVKEFFKKESGSGGPLKYSFFYLNFNFLLLNVLLWFGSCNTQMHNLLRKVLWQFAELFE